MTIAYGMKCSWYDDKEKVAVLKQDKYPIPCCPFCGKVLFEIDDIDWDKGIQDADARHPGYANFIAWSRGKCRTNQIALFREYELTGKTVEGWRPKGYEEIDFRAER